VSVAWRLFTVTVRAARRLSPSFVRVTFTGPDLDLFASNGLDQRIKVMLPLPGRGLVDCPTGPDWYGEWRALPAERQLPIRTYTVRAVRSDPVEVDVDFVLHGATGPASAWAEQAAAGDEIVLVGPNAVFEGPTGGVEWHPPADARCLLIAGDETAVPAVASILETLPHGYVGQALLEVPDAADFQQLRSDSDVEVTWLARGTRARGELLADAVRSAADPLREEADDDLPDVDPDAGILWETPQVLGATPSAAAPYAWIAGEAAMVRDLRRHLVGEVGLPRTAVAFMGYWREGRAL